MDSYPIWGLILNFIVINALATAIKTSLEYVNKAEIEKKEEEGDHRAKRVNELLAMPHKYINLIKIINTSAILLIGIIYCYEFGHIAELIEKNVFGEESILAVWFCMLLISILLVYIVVLFGNLLPKKLAIRYAESYAYFLSKIAKILIVIFTPMIWLIESSTNLFLRLVRINPSELEDIMTEEEIISIVNEGHEQGVLEAKEVEMISNIIEFNEKEACDIMTHRSKIVAISEEMTIEEALNFMLIEKHTRYPLYQENIDNIIGVLHLRDVMISYKDEIMRTHSVKKAAREPYFIPETQNINVLFRDMQKKKIQMAIAFDEYGQTAGLVAMEDILEEIVGDIQDEYDDEEEMIKLSDEENVYIVQGEANLEELGEIIGIPFEEEDLEMFDTLNGFLISKIEHIPDDNEIAIIDYYGFRFDIKTIKNKMIKSVRIFPIVQEKEFVEEEADRSNQEEG